MSVGRYRMMEQLKDEDKWAKYFTKPQLVALILALVLAFKIAKIMYSIGLLLPGLVISITILLGTGFLVMAPVPRQKYIFGGGEMLYTIALRVVTRKFVKKKKIIYSAVAIDMEEDGLK